MERHSRNMLIIITIIIIIIVGSALLGAIQLRGCFSWSQHRFWLHPCSSFGWMYKPMSSLCMLTFHHLDWAFSDIPVLDRWMPVTKTHPACTIHEVRMWLPVWLGKSQPHIHKSHYHGEPHGSNWELRRRGCCWLVAYRPINMRVYLRNGSAQTILRAATLR